MATQSGEHFLSPLFTHGSSSRLLEALDMPDMEPISELSAGVLDLVITIVACDVCRMYEQQINLIDASNNNYYIEKFAKDCVYRITKRLKTRESTEQLFFPHLQLNIDKDVYKKRLEILRKLRDSRNGYENIKSACEYIIEGLWAHPSKPNLLITLATGARLPLSPVDSKSVLIQPRQIFTYNLIDRIFVKDGKEFFFPRQLYFNNCKKFFGKCNEG